MQAFSGAGSPEGKVAAFPGSTYLDMQNSRSYFKAQGEGATGWELAFDPAAQGGTSKLSQTLIRGRLKLDERPTGGTLEDYAFQIRAESGKTSGTIWGLDNETHQVVNGTGTIRSTQGVAVVDTGKSNTGGSLTGIYGQARADGTFNSPSGFVTGVYGLVEASAAMTASHVASIWADSHQDNAVTGSHELIYASNNGAAVLDQMIFFYGQANALLTVDHVQDTTPFVTAGTAADGTPVKVKIIIKGTPYYINAYPTDHP